MEQLEKKKTRHLTTYEFFEAIQVEYICCLLRSKIYKKVRDKIYWSKVAEGKKAVIESISSRNGDLPTIFSDSDLLQALQRRVYNDNGTPYFSYKDKDHKLVQEYFDLLYYYSLGSQVRYDVGLGLQIGKIISYKPFSKTITVETNEEKIDLEVFKVVRIL